MFDAVLPRTLVIFVSGGMLGVGLLGVPACGSESSPNQAQPTAKTAPESDAPKSEPAPAKPAPIAHEEPIPPPIVEADPVVAERKLALANVGRSAFDALKAGKFAALLELTPIDEGPLRDACPSMPLTDRRELEARFEHCHETIAWDRVEEAQVFAGKPTGDPATGCEAGIEDYGRIQLFMHMQDKTIWRVELYGAVGKDGNAVGINGEVVCTKVDEAPAL
jgi:hypothetical protein